MQLRKVKEQADEPHYFCHIISAMHLTLGTGTWNISILQLGAVHINSVKLQGVGFRSIINSCFGNFRWLPKFQPVECLQVFVSNVTIQCDQASDASFKAAQILATNSSLFLSAVKALSALGVSGNILVGGLITMSEQTGWPAWGSHPIMLTQVCD